MKRKGLGNTIRDGGLHFPYKIYLGSEALLIERPVKPDNGPANIKVFQVAEHVRLQFPCAVLNNGDLDDELFHTIWSVAQGVGLGANRHLGYGLFRVHKVEAQKDDRDFNLADLLSMEVMTNQVPKSVDSEQDGVHGKGNGTADTKRASRPSMKK